VGSFHIKKGKKKLLKKTRSRQNKDKESFSREATPSVVYLKGTKKKKCKAKKNQKHYFQKRKSKRKP